MIRRMPEAAVYQQLAALLRGQIMDGTLRPLQHLPSENALMQQYGLARDTVRRAIGMLRTEGLVVVEPGRGTWVRQEGEPKVVRLPRGARTSVRMPTPDEVIAHNWPAGVPVVVVRYGQQETVYSSDNTEFHSN